MVVVLTLITPLLVVLTYQWAPRRELRPADEMIHVALASMDELASVGAAAGVRPLARLERDEIARGHSLTSVALVDRSGSSRPQAWYRAAAAAHGISPYLLEAVHQIESSAAPDGCLPNIEGSGAVGPFQFKPVTFQSHGVDGNLDGVTDICGFADLLYSAAAYLQSLGAGPDIDGTAVREALARYGTDPDRVIDLARYYRARDLALTAEAPVTH